MHVLDTSLGKPASGVPVLLEFQSSKNWKELARSQTNMDGRVSQLLPESSKLEVGRYRITFDTGVYFKKNNTNGFYPYAQIVFEVLDPSQHYHIPLLLSPFGYSTYRGS